MINFCVYYYDQGMFVMLYWTWDPINIVTIIKSNTHWIKDIV